MTYKILSHTADLRMAASGKDYREIFESALAGMADILKQGAGRFPAVKKRKIKIASPDYAALLIDFLNEALYLAQTNNEVYFIVHFKDLSPTGLEAEISGIPTEKFDEDIKAATYHEIEIHKNKKGELEAIIVFDV
ncbi:MAG: archease [Patescibacteria group bacterium]